MPNLDLENRFIGTMRAWAIFKAFFFLKKMFSVGFLELRDFYGPSSDLALKKCRILINVICCLRCFINQRFLW